MLFYISTLFSDSAVNYWASHSLLEIQFFNSKIHSNALFVRL